MYVLFQQAVLAVLLIFSLKEMFLQVRVLPVLFRQSKWDFVSYSCHYFVTLIVAITCCHSLKAHLYLKANLNPTIYCHFKLRNHGRICIMPASDSYTTSFWHKNHRCMNFIYISKRGLKWCSFINKLKFIWNKWVFLISCRLKFNLICHGTLQI